MSQSFPENSPVKLSTQSSLPTTGLRASTRPSIVSVASDVYPSRVCSWVGRAVVNPHSTAAQENVRALKWTVDANAQNRVFVFFFDPEWPSPESGEPRQRPFL